MKTSVVTPVRQVRLQARVEPEIAKQLAELTEIEVELRDGQGQRLLLVPGHLVSLERVRTDGPARGHLLIDISAVVSLPPDPVEEERRQESIEASIARIREIEGNGRRKPPPPKRERPKVSEASKQKNRKLSNSEKLERDSRIVEARKAGDTHAQIAAREGLSDSGVSKILRANGIASAADVQQLVERDQEIVRLRLAGMAPTAIARRYNLTRERVGQILQWARAIGRLPEG